MCNKFFLAKKIEPGQPTWLAFPLTVIHSVTVRSSCSIFQSPQPHPGPSEKGGKGLGRGVFPGLDSWQGGSGLISWQGHPPSPGPLLSSRFRQEASPLEEQPQDVQPQSLSRLLQSVFQQPPVRFPLPQQHKSNSKYKQFICSSPLRYYM